MPYERKFDKVDLVHTELDLSHEDGDKAWSEAIEHVEMGVCVVPILVNQPTYSDTGAVIPTTQAETLIPGDYTTDSGREGSFFMVMVDRNNTEEFKALAPCSDYYAAIEPADIYRSLREALGEAATRPLYCYNSYNGGRQVLRLDVINLEGIDVEEHSGIRMELVLKTSLDKSSNHALDVRPVLEDGTPILFSDTKGHGYNFKVRHTTAAKAEIVNFNVAAASITHNWNDNIIPYIRFLSGGEFNAGEVAALMDSILEDAKLPKDIAAEIQSAFKASKVDVSSIGGEALKAVATISSVVTNRDVTPMAKHRDEEKVSKAITQNVRRLFHKMGE